MSVDTRGVQTDLTNVVDRNNDKVNEIIRLIGAHCKFGTLKKYHQPITIATAVFPMCFVQPRTFDPTFEATGLYSDWGDVTIYVYHGENAADRVGEDVLASVAILDKLFSVNALNDQGTPAPTGRYFANAPFWVESKFGPATYGEIVAIQKDAEQLFVAQARVTFRYHDLVQP